MKKIKQLLKSWDQFFIVLYAITDWIVKAIGAFLYIMLFASMGALLSTLVVSQFLSTVIILGLAVIGVMFATGYWSDKNPFTGKRLGLWLGR